ncbi:hypothetical protein [Longitalea luteola]|uniref:hypothetical protein n=1 Tax=Longitalea luteola TaxID=2812563 RepID=UPI001A97B1D8|nr:hypothetical protein [Longitalea luteola]
MKIKGNTQPVQLTAAEESSSLRLVYKKEEVINEEKKTVSKTKAPNKLYVKEPLPLFNDYKFKAKDHDPL